LDVNVFIACFVALLLKRFNIFKGMYPLNEDDTDFE